MATTTNPKKSTKKKPSAPEVFADRDIERVRVEKEIAVPMSAVEHARDTDRHAEVVLEIEQHETELAAYQKQKRKLLKPLRKESRELARAIKARQVHKTVECIEERIFRTNTVRYVYPSGELISERAMVPGEFDQRTIDDVANAARVDVEEDDAPPATGPVH